MKKSIIYLGVALLGFGSLANATNTLHNTPTEVGIFAKYYATPLCLAISNGEVEVVKKFIEYGADVNERTNGMTPLMYAARYNQTEIIKLLISKGADVKAKCKNGLNALKYAEISNATEAAELLRSSMKG